MKIDTTDISTLNATLLGYDIGTTEFENIYTVFQNSPYFTFFNSIKALRPLSIRLYVEGTSEENVDISISKIISLCSEQCVVKFNDDDLLSYDCVFASNEIEKVNVYNKKIMLSFYCVCHEDMEVKELTALDKVVTNTGTCKVPCIIELSTTTALTDVVVAEITIASLPANKTIIIDGIGKTVTIDNVNVLLNTDLTTFPQLEIGTNTINHTAGTVTVKYYPTYI